MGSGSTALARGLLVFAAVGAWYAFACWAWPYRRCRHCGGGGKVRSPTGSHFRYCRRCGGQGGKLRAGRRIWTFLHR
ncbi:MAG TPA: hypothetical protein VGP02_19815 [Mycobacteriales bacterium]|nr:hypothetical protein [Mycobacteriales bacterium]